MGYIICSNSTNITACAATGTTISLHFKEEAYDFVEVDTVKTLVRKYSQFINFPIYLWESTTSEVEEPIDEEDEDDNVAEDKVRLPVVHDS